DGEVPFEPPPDVDQDRQHAEADGQEAGLREFLADGRTDNLGALEIRIRDDRGDTVADLLQGCGLRLFTARLTLDADENRGTLTELLKGHLTEVEAFHPGADGRKVDRRLRGGFHLDAADEVDAVVQARREEQDDRGRRDEGRHADGDVTPTHEGEGRDA